MGADRKLMLVLLATISLEAAQAVCFNESNIIVLGKESGRDGRDGRDGRKGDKGEKGDPGVPGQSCDCKDKEIDNDLLIHVLNDYYVSENAYYNKVYQVTSKALTDGRSDTGGYGSKSSSAGNWLQATYYRPVYVTSVQMAGGFIPSWNHGTNNGYGEFYLQYSKNGLHWMTARSLPKTVGTYIVSYALTKPITAQYWRLTSINNWIATTEFALKPLIKPQ